MNNKFHSAPLQTDVLFETCPVTGPAWQQYCSAENILAEKLKNMPQGTAVFNNDGDIWFLKLKDNKRILCHAEYINNAENPLLNVSSRFDFDLAFIDIDEDELEEYSRRITVATEEFSTTNIPLSETE
jgi:hypothetical protein